MDGPLHDTQDDAPTQIDEYQTEYFEEFEENYGAEELVDEDEQESSEEDIDNDEVEDEKLQVAWDKKKLPPVTA